MQNMPYEVVDGKVAQVAVIMGSQSDWPTMRLACVVLGELQIWWVRYIISAHRTPERMHEFATSAKRMGYRVIIAGAGGAAHLPGMVAGSTRLPVHGVPIKTSTLNGIDSLYSIVQMPKGVPTATFSIGEAGAVNAALQAARVLALFDDELDKRLAEYIYNQTNSVPEIPVDQEK